MRSDDIFTDARDGSHANQAAAAFNHAIRTGRLSEVTARDHMFMGFDALGRACFKHRNTRAYLPHDAAACEEQRQACDDATVQL